MPSRTVVARETELDRLRDFLAGEGSQSLVLRGEPGIGKTILWQAAVEEARALRCRVLVHRAAEAETGLAFTGLADLVAPVLDEVAEVLPEPRRQALRVALLLEAPGAAPPAPQAIGLALLDVLTALCAQDDVVVAIDDLQWLDSSTAGVLPLALRRLGDSRLKLLATLREAQGVRAPFELASVVGEDRAGEIRLQALTLSALHRLLGDRLGLELPRPQLTRLHHLSGGNPLYALELARTGDLRVPRNLHAALDARLARLTDVTADVLLAAAALARPTVRAVAPDALRREALESAIDAHVIELEDELVRFTHPLLASRCYERATPWRRREVHRALASVVDRMEERARHLALAAEGPDEPVAEQLDAAVAQAAGRGATAAAAELAEMAVSLTPGDAISRRSAAAHFHHLAGDFLRASELYGQLVEDLPAGVERADALYVQALIGLGDLPGRVRLCERALEDAHADDVRCAGIHGYQAINRWLLGDLRTARGEAKLGLERAQRAGDSRTLAVAMGRVGLMEAWALDVTPGLLDRALEIRAGLHAPLLFVESPGFSQAVSLVEIGQLDAGRAMLGEFLSSALRNGDEHSRQWTLLLLASCDWYAGRLASALEYTVQAREVAAQTGEPQFLGMVERQASVVQASLGQFDDARASGRRALDAARRVGDEIWGIGSLAALGYVELVAGDLPAAIGHLRDLPTRQLHSGQRSPVCDPWVDTLEVLIGLGELDEAQEHLDCYRGLSSIAYPRGRVGAARAEGLLDAARGNKHAALRALEESLRADDPPTFPLERARTLLALGSVQRQTQQRRAARETLNDAAALFASVGAGPWAAKAQAELARISGRGAAASDELTRAERSVAELAAAGRKNKEIAAALFIGVGTVEAHLSRVYRKLGVRSRAELTARFTRDAASNRGVGPSQG